MSQPTNYFETLKARIAQMMKDNQLKTIVSSKSPQDKVNEIYEYNDGCKCEKVKYYNHFGEEISYGQNQELKEVFEYPFINTSQFWPGVDKD